MYKMKVKSKRSLMKNGGDDETTTKETTTKEITSEDIEEDLTETEDETENEEEEENEEETNESEYENIETDELSNDDDDDNDDNDNDNDNNKIVKRIVKNEERISDNFLSVYEYVRALSIRSKQIMTGSKIMLKGGEELRKKLKPVEISKLEIKNKCCPLIVVREMPNGNIEHWDINELDLLNLL